MNPHRGKDGTWGYPIDLRDFEPEAAVITPEAMTEGAYLLRGFYDEKQRKACNDGKPMTDINPARFPSRRGPRDV